MSTIAPPAAPSPAPAPAPGTRQWTPGRVVGVAGGIGVLLLALLLLAAGGIVRLTDAALRDADGYLMTTEIAYDSPGYAVQSQGVELPGGFDDRWPGRWLGTVKAEAHARSDDGVFVGIARTSDVEAYLDGVAHSEVVDRDGRGPDTVFTDGGPPAAPADQDFWVASAQGPDQQTITWDPRPGTWTLVVMNGSGTTPVAADVAFGAELPVLDVVDVALLVAGLLLLVIGVPLLWWGAARAGRVPR